MNISAFLKSKTGPLPNWVWASVIVVGLGVGIFVMKRQQASQAADTPSDPNAGADLSTTPGYPDNQYNGHEIIIVPLGDITTQNNVPEQTTRGRSGDKTRTIPPKKIATIRQRYSSSIQSVMDYDKASPNGVPVRPVPGSPQEVYKVGYGSQIELLGDAVSGPSNVRESGQGSSSWYPVAHGYLSSFDVASVSTQNTSPSPQVSTMDTNSSGKVNTVQQNSVTKTSNVSN